MMTNRSCEFCSSVIGQQPAVARQLPIPCPPKGGQPYPMPLPPEGSQNHPIDTGLPSPTVRCVFMKKLQ